MFTQTEVKDIINYGDVLQGYRERDGGTAVFSPSVYKLLTYIQKHMPEPLRGKESSSRRSTWDDFHYFEDWEECLDVYLNNPNSLVTFDRLNGDLLTPNEVGNEIYYDVTGDFFDVGLLLEGEPEHWGNAIMGNPRRVFANIYVNNSISGSVSAEILSYRARHILALVDWLESQHVRTRIISAWNSFSALVETVVKNYDEPLDLAALAIAANPDFHRRIEFRVAEYSKTWAHGYGSGVDVVKAVNDNITVVVNQMYSEKNVSEFFIKTQTEIMDTISRGETQIMCVSRR